MIDKTNKICKDKFPGSLEQINWFKVKIIKKVEGSLSYCE